MKTKNNLLEDIVSFAKQTGYIFQGSEIYGGLSNTFDYGPLGALLKRNIKDAWTQKFIRQIPGNVLLDGSILLNPQVWQASGHLSGFSDPLMECKACNSRFRADNLLMEIKNIDVAGWDNDKIYDYLNKENITCPHCHKLNWTKVRSFNMMFKTQQGVIADSSADIYLRPENAQNVFIQFKNVQRTTRAKLPFGIGHIGKAFRNEITPGNFIFRTREFEQMELEFFTKPHSEKELFLNLKTKCMEFLKSLGIKKEKLRFDDHKPEQLSHYSNATTDIQYEFPWGFDELWGIASRTDFDLKSHMNASKEDLTYLDPETNERYLPFVVEPSVGVERLVLAFLTSALEKEILPDNTERTVLKLHPFLSPYKVCVLPLIKKNHSEVARAIYEKLTNDFDCTYDDSQNIGKRYRRQDMIGTPFCITVDDETINKQTVTIRYRDTMKQEVISVNEIREFVSKQLTF